MDPLTQGTLGAAVCVALLNRRAPFSTGQLAWMGALGGMAADLDVLIRSGTDPLLAIEYHRHFTHSLVFIPIGGAVAALPWLLWQRTRQHFNWALLAATIGYATHGPLDACTTYGTLLFWPFSEFRVSLRFISVVDVVFTLPLLASLIVGVRRGDASLVSLGLAFAAGYMTLGAFQNWRASALQGKLASERGHFIERGQVFPTFTNNVTWRSVYQSQGRYYVDKLRLTLTGKACVTSGTSVSTLADPELSRDSDLHPASARAHRLIRWFAAGWVARDPEAPSVIGDLRYSFTPSEVAPIWGVRIQDQTGEVEWVNNRDRRAITLDHFFALVMRDGERHHCY